MSGIIGHTMYAILGAQAASHRQLPVAPALQRHWASYLCGSYLGCDIQTLPEAICVETGQEVGYGTVPLEKSPLTGGPVKRWSMTVEDQPYTPVDIHRLFYGRAHLVFGWQRGEAHLRVPWDHLADYFACVIADALSHDGPGERQLAYLFGTMAHVVGDSLIKSIQPGVTLDLLDGKYTPRNRPIQDLVTFHEIGIAELKLNWPALLIDLAGTPVEPVQKHAMRIGQPRGELGGKFDAGWRPDLEPLLERVLAENRRYLKAIIPRWLKELELMPSLKGTGLECSAQIRELTGLPYAEMVELAEKAGFRHALWQIGEAVADLFEAVTRLQPALQNLPPALPPWETQSARWRLLGK